jgi:hypothetical protein
MDASTWKLNEFPRISVDYLRDITMGIYQVKLKQASNKNEHVTEDGNYEVMVCMDFPGLLHVKKSSLNTQKIKFI